MASEGTFTVTGTAGAGEAVTAGVFGNIRSFTIDIEKAMLELVQATPNRIIRIAISAATTITVTLSAAAGNYTVSIS